MKIMKKLGVCALAMTMMSASAAAQEGNPNPGVMPVHSSAHGGTYGDWAAAWWQWVLPIDPEISPIADETGEFCDVDQTGEVWYLAGTTGIVPVERECTIPAGKSLFIPLINFVAWAPEDGKTEEELRGLANLIIDLVDVLECSVDGEELADLYSYRADSPAFAFEGGDAFGISGGRELAVADGYWLMLAPLSAGEHEIHFKGGITGVFETEVTYYLTIE